MWVCQKCKKENQGKFCELCGAKQPHQAYHYAESEWNARKAGINKTVLYVCITVVSIAIITVSIVLGMAIMSNLKDNTAVREKEEMSEAGQKTVSKSNNETGSDADAEQNDKFDSTPDADGNYDTEQDSIENVDGESNSVDSRQENVEIKYGRYTNDTYDFYCDYPSDFAEATPRGVNALKTYVSEDGTAEMTIRAQKNTDSVSTQQALNEFISVYGNPSYKASGDTWYVASIRNGGKTIYRKFFNQNGNICCMDFIVKTEDEEKYSPYIEHIEDNFKLY